MSLLCVIFLYFLHTLINLVRLVLPITPLEMKCFLGAMIRILKVSQVRLMAKEKAQKDFS